MPHFWKSHVAAHLSTKKALERLCRCAALSDLLLLIYAISTKIFTANIQQGTKIPYHSLTFFIAYAFKGQVLVFAGWVNSYCRTCAILKYFCPMYKDPNQEYIINTFFLISQPNLMLRMLLKQIISTPKTHTFKLIYNKITTYLRSKYFLMLI